MTLPPIGGSRTAFLEQRDEGEVPSSQPKAAPDSVSFAGPNPAAGRSMKFQLNAILRTANNFKETRDSSVFRHCPERRLLNTDNHGEASRLVQRVMDVLERAHAILYGDPLSGENGHRQRKKVHKRLTKLADEIKVFTTTLKSTGPIRENTPSIVTPRAARPESSTRPRNGNAPDTGPLEPRIIAKCQELIESLTPLCLAADQPDGTTDSVLDHYIEVKEGLPLGAELQAMLLHAAFAQTVYADSLQENLGDKLGKAAPLLASALPESWASKNISDSLFADFKTACPNLQKFGDGRLCDSDSGLVLQIFENPATKQAVIAFGGTSAGESKGSLLERVLLNLGITLRQWRANISNATGVSLIGSAVPDSYQRAAQLTAILLQSLQGEGWSVSITGHSKGGAEAEFAALSNRLSAACFGTPPLGKHVLETFDKEAFQVGKRVIHHYFVKGDLAPISGTLLAPVLGRMHAHVGIGYWMDPTDEIVNTYLKSLWCHDQFFSSARDEAVRQTQDRDS